MNIKELKKELGISNKEIAEFFGLTPISYANSSAKKRYENALCNFYSFLREKKKKNQDTADVDTSDKD